MPDRVFQNSDVTANDSDKTFTVPAKTHWRIFTINVIYSPSAVGGNRLLRVDYRDDSDNIIFRVASGFPQATGVIVSYNYYQGSDVTKATVLTDGAIEIAIPDDIVLLPGYDIRIYDSVVVDVADDDMLVRMMIGERVTTA